VQKFLIIQTAFIGDVVLATCLIEKLHQHFPASKIDFLLRKGNEALLFNHPKLNQIISWDKKKNKQKNLLGLLHKIRKEKYDKVINVQRFASTGLLTAFSGAKETIGFDKNPFCFLFNKRVAHSVDNGKHEIERNLELIKSFTDAEIVKPKLYPSDADYKVVEAYKQYRYITVSPASVWFTKQYPSSKWVSFIDKVPDQIKIYLCGAPGDSDLCAEIIQSSKHRSIINLSGKLTFLQSAALMKDAVMNYANDSAPMHFASAMNAPVAAVFCSTIPGFGFGPLSDKRFVIEIQQALDCRPCGLHGYKACPRGHFNCAYQIKDEQLTEALGVHI